MKGLPRLYVPYLFDNGAMFTQRVDVPLSYTNATGAGIPGGGYTRQPGRNLHRRNPYLAGDREGPAPEGEPALRLSDRWSLRLYPENPITYNEPKKTWFVSLDVSLQRRIDSTYVVGVGTAYKLGNPSSASFRYVIDALLIVHD